MTALLDVSVLVALLIDGHEFHDRVANWIARHKIAVCAISELGFLRVASLAYGVPLNDAQEVLKQFRSDYGPAFVACDISALEGRVAPSGAKTTDFYLANLADHHGMCWATLDVGVTHPAALVVR